MAVVVKVFPDEPDILRREYLDGASDKVIACRAQQHAWPLLKPGRLPKGVSARPGRDGAFQIEFTCSNCGTIRVKTTLPGGEWDASAVYRYRHPAGFRAPKGSGITRADCMAELWRRMMENTAAELAAGLCRAWGGAGARSPARGCPVSRVAWWSRSARRPGACCASRCLAPARITGRQPRCSPRRSPRRSRQCPSPS